jgi:hypothetical protein
MAGDMHVSPPDAIDRVADALVGAQADECEELRHRIATVLEGDDVRQAEATMGVTTDDLLAAVDTAIAAASGTTRRGKRQRRAALGGDSERSERSEPSEGIAT